MCWLAGFLVDLGLCFSLSAVNNAYSTENLLLSEGEARDVPRTVDRIPIEFLTALTLAPRRTMNR